MGNGKRLRRSGRRAGRPAVLTREARRRRRAGALLAALLLAAAAVLLLLRPGGPGGGGSAGLHAQPRGTSWHRAALAATPGALNPDVTQATIAATICKRGWTRTIRPPVSYTNRLKLQQIAAAGLPGGPRDYQEDHFISLELGGHPTDVRNLWPEPRPYAEQVDRYENELNRAVCKGRLTLAEAQRLEARQKHDRG